MKDFAPGIPYPKVTTAVPLTTYKIWDYVIQKHEADKAGLHYDLRLGGAASGVAHSWVIKSIPMSGQKVLAIEQSDHTLEYMRFSGRLGKGYGKGYVTIAAIGKAEILESGPDKIVFNIYQGADTQRYLLLRTNGKNWLFYNTTNTRDRVKIPDKKRHYKEIKINDLDPNKPDTLWSPKIDGAHNLFYLKKGRRPEIFSYRISKRDKNKLIEHTYKTDLYKQRVPDSLGETILRGELYGVDDRGKVISSAQTAGILNSNVWKARSGHNGPINGRIQHMVFDIDKYRGKDVSDAPYSQKLLMLKEVQKQMPSLKLAPMISDPAQKAHLLKNIKEGNNPLSREGIIEFDLNKSTPIKAKIKKDMDVFVVSVFPGAGKYSGNAAGGFLASSTYGAPATIRVGSGFTDAQRIHMWNNRSKYGGRLAKIEIQDELPSGKVRAPVFKEWRSYI